MSLEQNILDTEKDLSNVKVQIPNDLIQRLLEAGINNLAWVAYANYFLIISALLTKYCCFVSSTQDLLTRKEISNFIGLKRDDKMSKLVKRNGVLDVKGFLKYTKNIPLAYLSNVNDEDSGLIYFEDYKVMEIEEILGLDLKKLKNYFVPIPSFLFENADGDEGALVNYCFTYELKYSQLSKIAACKQKGVTNYILLYIYSNLRSLSYGRESIQISAQTIDDMGLINRNTFYKYAKVLEEIGLIRVERKFNNDRGIYKTNRYFFK